MLTIDTHVFDRGYILHPIAHPGHYQDSTSQDITFMSSLYWVIITGLAVGYGDFHPDDNIGYMFNFFYSFILFLWTFRQVTDPPFLFAVLRRPVIARTRMNSDSSARELEAAGAVTLALPRLLAASDRLFSRAV